MSWREGAPERGFAMAMDELACAHYPDTTVVTARDGQGTVRGFLHLVPTYGRKAMSLSCMRRDRGTPNGLMEYLVVRAIEELRARDIEEISLNFAAFARWMHAPRNRANGGSAESWRSAIPSSRSRACIGSTPSSRRVGCRATSSTSARLDLPRIGLATMRVEGQLPVLSRRFSRRAVQAT